MVRTRENVAAAGADATYVEMQHITDGVMFLASAAAEAITGQVLPDLAGARSSMELAGRVALVTGAGRRLGRAFAGALAARGMTVALHYNAVEGRRRVAPRGDRGGAAAAQPASRPISPMPGRRVHSPAGSPPSSASWTCW